MQAKKHKVSLAAQNLDARPEEGKRSLSLKNLLYSVTSVSLFFHKRVQNGRVKAQHLRVPTK